MAKIYTLAIGKRCFHYNRNKLGLEMLEDRCKQFHCSLLLRRLKYHNLFPTLNHFYDNMHPNQCHSTPHALARLTYPLWSPVVILTDIVNLRALSLSVCLLLGLLLVPTNTKSQLWTVLSKMLCAKFSHSSSNRRYWGSIKEVEGVAIDMYILYIYMYTVSIIPSIHHYHFSINCVSINNL